jgi:hypothetical protein
MRYSSLVLGSLVLAASLSAQGKPGQYLCTVGNNITTGEMFMVDPFTKTATQLTLDAILVSEVVNCVHMISPAIGYVGTAGNATTTGSVYRITITGLNVTATKLNTTATAGQNLAQIDRIGSDLYFITQEQVTTTSVNGRLYSMPAAGGPVTELVDFKTITGWPSGALTNALATDGTGKVYVGVWTVGLIYEYDVMSKATKLLLTLPNSKYPSTGFYPVHMIYRAGKLYVGGLFGDAAEVDIATATTTNHWFAKTAAPTGQSLYKNSMCINDNGDFAMGSRDGSLDIVVPTGDGHIARRHVAGVGANTTLTANSVNGVWFFSPAGGSYAAHGAGCPGTGGFLPTSVNRGALSKGNASFAFGLDTAKSGTNIAVLILGGTKLSANLGFGGCFLRNDPIILLAAATGAGLDGQNQAQIAIPLPNDTLTLYTQWGILDSGANTVGLAFSDGRQLKL